MSHGHMFHGLNFDGYSRLTTAVACDLFKIFSAQWNETVQSPSVLPSIYLWDYSRKWSCVLQQGVSFGFVLKYWRTNREGLGGAALGYGKQGTLSSQGPPSTAPSATFQILGKLPSRWFYLLISSVDIPKRCCFNRVTFVFFTCQSAEKCVITVISLSTKIQLHHQLKFFLVFCICRPEDKLTW